jgi:hypothetical protein
MSFEDEMKRRNTKLDVKADTWLDKLKASKWTGWIILGLALAVAFLIVKVL